MHLLILDKIFQKEKFLTYFINVCYQMRDDKKIDLFHIHASARACM